MQKREGREWGVKTIVKNTLSLTAITLVMGILLGAVHYVTARPIAVQEQKKVEEAYREVFPEADHFEEQDMGGLSDRLSRALSDGGHEEEQIDAVAQALDGDGALLGYVLTVTTSQGYGGDIQLTMGVAEDGTTEGISFLSIEETAGLGMRADTEEFRSQFSGKRTDSFAYTKTGASGENEIDALSGATVTTNAVTSAVNAGLTAFQALNEEGGETE